MTSDRRPLEGAPPEGRHLLGALLRQRRLELGYAHRTAFCQARLPRTPHGNLNTRMAADIEEAYREDFPEGRLRQLAHAYLVTYVSAVGVAWLRTGALAPASYDAPAPEALPDEPPGWLPPMADPARAAAARPIYEQIQGRLDLLRARGTAEPSGRQLFPDAPEDAKTWDGVGARLPLDDRVWLIAELRRRDAARGNGPDTINPGALLRSKFAGRACLSHTTSEPLARAPRFAFYESLGLTVTM